ncbi:B12-binding domain-containing protein [Bacillaceae bacterium IKA-2]|nr:B12-binding domain-containing protein [Bacillaceae bacterium IKA-2]
MSLLFQNSIEKIDKLAQLAYDRLFELDPKLETEYNDRQKRSMYQDILSSIEYLNLAMKFNDNKIFIGYAVWLYQSLSYSIKKLGNERIKDQMCMRYQVLEELIGDHLSADEASQAYHHLDNAIMATENEFVNFQISSRFEAPEYLNIKREYLSLLLKNDAKGAYYLIERSFNSGVKLDDIYLKVLQEVLYELGNLWHQNIISIDKEYYCTSTTQIVLSQFYPLIFSQPKNGYKILSCAVGT